MIDQRKPAPNARSTVGTYTDIYALLRLLFSRVGKPFVGYSDTFSFNHLHAEDIHHLISLLNSMVEQGNYPLSADSNKRPCRRSIFIQYTVEQQVDVFV